MYDEDIRDDELLLEDDELEEENDGNDLLGEMGGADDELIDDDPTEIVDDPIEGVEEPVDRQRVRNAKIADADKQKVKGAGMQTDVDMVFVIDCTGSMEPFLAKVKQMALSFHDQVREALGIKNRRIRKIRIKVIAYRDYYCDWADPDHPPMLISEFFTLPDEAEEFADFVNSLEAAGGEDEPESALEALHHAFNSEWFVDPTIAKCRQIVVVFTDASAHKLDNPKRYITAEHNGEYPEDGMPTTLEELETEYNSPDVFPAEADGVTIKGHRLILFAPEDMYPWNEMQNWIAANCESMDPETGLENIDMEAVINLIGGSC